MKIIGTSNGGFIAEISGGEIQTMAGWSYDDFREKRIGPGTVINVSASFHRITELSSQVEKRKSIAGQLRAMAELVELIPDALTQEDEEVAQ